GREGRSGDRTIVQERPGYCLQPAGHLAVAVWEILQISGLRNRRSTAAGGACGRRSAGAPAPEQLILQEDENRTRKSALLRLYWLKLPLRFRHDVLYSSRAGTYGEE